MTSFDDDDIISGRSRRRCVKGRVSYLESDNLGPALSEDIDLNEEQTDSPEIPADDPVCNETLETEEYDGEPVTIDLSEFLSESGLLAEALAENAPESAAALSDCHSQFRVTSSKTDPPLCPVVGDLPSLKELSLNEKTLPSEDSTLPVNPSSSVGEVLASSGSTDLGEENVPLEKNISSALLASEDSVVKTLVDQSTARQKEEGTVVAKDVLENPAAEALGKFPIVRCEKLNMENFVKKNAIKVGNWPLPKANSTPKSKFNVPKSNSVKKPRSASSKTPKVFNKPISFNRLVPKNSNGPMVRSILVNPFEIKPPGVYSIDNSGVPRFVTSHAPVRTCLNEYSLGGDSIIKVVSKNVMNRFPIITGVNKVGGPSKTLKIISPKRVSPAVAEHKNVGVTPILPKPVIETITSPVLLNDSSFTVIEPYVDDPTSPVRPKPILTVPVEVIPSIDGGESNELANNLNEFTPTSKVFSKQSKSSRSVFLNGAIKQTSVPTRYKKEPTPRSKSILTENNLAKVDTVLQNFSDSELEEAMPINKAKSAVVDAMASVFSKNTKRQNKSKQNNKDSQNQSGNVADSSMFGCQSYNNSLNDILFGFGSVDDDLITENLDEDVSAELSYPPSPPKVNKQPEVTFESQKKTAVKNKNHNTFSNVIPSYPEHIFDDACADSDTLSASECGDDNDLPASKAAVTKTQRRQAKAIKKKIRRGRRSNYSLEPNKKEEQSLCKTPDLSHKKSFKENSIPQSSDDESELNESKNMYTCLKKEAVIEKSTEYSKDVKDVNTPLRKNTKETRLTSRGKRKPSNENINTIVKQEPVEEPSEEKPKKPFKTRKGNLQFLHSRLKRNVKAKQNVNAVKRVKKKLSRPSDIIQEIKTITSGNSMVQKGKRPSKENINTSESKVVNPLSKSNAKHHKRKIKPIRPKSKKKIKTLKVLFKRSKQKQTSDIDSPSPSLIEDSIKSDSENESRTESISDLPSKNMSENLNSSCEKIPISTDSPEISISPDNVEENKVLSSSDQSNQELQNLEIKEMEDTEKSSKIDPSVSKENTDASDAHNDACSTLSEELFSERSEEPTELVSDATDQRSSPEDDGENNNDKSSISALNIHKNDSDSKDGFKSEEPIASFPSEEEISPEEPKLHITNDSDCINSELQNSETSARKNSNLVSTESVEADSGEITDQNEGSSFLLDAINPALREETIEKFNVPVSGGLDTILESKNLDKKESDNECSKTDLSVPEETMDRDRSLQSPSDACTNIDGNTCANIITSNSLVNSDSVSAILEESKTENLSEPEEEEQDIVKSKVTRKRKKKKSCPKLKISKTMADQDSVGRKNWYVSERKASTDSTELDQNILKSNKVESSETLCENLVDSEASNLVIEISSNSLKSAHVNDISSSEAVIDSNLSAASTLEKNSCHSSISSTRLKLLSENKSDSVISCNDRSDNSNLLENEKSESDHNFRVLPHSSPKNSSEEQEKADDENNVLEELLKPVAIKEALDSEESADNSLVDVNKDKDKKSDSVSLSKIRRRGRPRKNLPKSMVTKAKESQPLSGSGTTEITLHKGRKGKAKITSYFKPQASKSEESTMESVPVPVEVTSVPEEVTPNGATLPDETSIDAIHESTPIGSTLETTSLKAIPGKGTFIEAVPMEATSTEEATADADSKAAAPQNPTGVEGTPLRVNSVSASPAETTSTDGVSAASQKTLATQDSTCKEETSLNVTPAKASVALAQSTSKSTVTPNNTPSSRGRKRKFCPDAVQVPFKLGWMRELVHRSTEGKVGQKMSDIYYFSPEGIKLRSMVEIGNYLCKHSECTLTLENFTFAKECVYHEPFEIERSAKQRSVLSTLPKFYQTKILDRSKEMDAAMKSSPMKKFAPPLPSIPKLTIKNINQGQAKLTCVLGESSSNAKNKSNVEAMLDNVASPKKKLKTSSEKPSVSAKDSTKEKSDSQSLTSNDSERTAQSDDKNPDTAQNRSTVKQKLGGSKTANSSVKSRAKLKSKMPKKEDFHRPCSYHCAVAKLQIPNIKCALCYCLFHQHCIPSIAKGVGYACRSCVTAKLALYETIRNPLTSSLYSDGEERDIPLDLEPSFLYPEIQMKVSNYELKVFSASNKTNRNAASLNVRTPADSSPVPYMPCLVKHLLRPPSPLHQGVRTITSKTVVPMLPTPQQSGGNSVLPNSISATRKCAPILVRCTPSGSKVIRAGVVIAPSNTNPLSALQSLSQDISPSAKWSEVSSPLSSSTQSFSAKRSSLGEVSSKFQEIPVPTRVSDSILAATLSGRIPTECSYALVNQSDVNRILTGHDCLKLVFKMLDICDLLRVGQVCKSWNHIATESSLWERVKFSNIMVTNWKDCCLFLKKANTKHLDFLDIIHPSEETPFKSLEDHISNLNNVEEVLFDQIPSSLLQSVALNLHQLRKLECHFVTDAVGEEEIWTSSCTFKLSSLQGLNRLTKLKINSGGGIILKCDPEYLMPFLPNLRHLTLTGFKFDSHINLECLSMHKELISLELGDCSDIEPEVYALLGSLKKLRCLRLENGGSLEDIGFVNCLKKMKSLEILELMNFKIPNNFEKAFQHFKQLIHLNIWLDTTSEGPRVNNNLLQAITHCKDLSYACWGIITEGEDAPGTLEIRNHENKTEELNYEELFHKLVKLLPECRVEVKFVPRISWREFCSVRD